MFAETGVESTANSGTAETEAPDSRVCSWLAGRGRASGYWPLVVALVMLWLAIAFLAARSMEHQDAWTYSRDDAYIQMAVAKNIVEHGSWGVNAGEYNSASSSPFYAIILAGTYGVFGVNDFSPLVLNIIFTSLVVLAVFLILRRERLAPPYNFLVLMAVIFFAPLPALIPLGMEHGLQILLDVIFVYYISIAIGEGRRGRLERAAVWALAAAPALVFCRYEGLFLIVISMLLLFLKRRWLLSLALGGLGALPVVIFGIFSLSAGGQFLPNPLTLKSRIPLFPLADWLETNLTHAHDPIVSVLTSPLWLVLAVASVAVIALSFTRWDIAGSARGRVRAMNTIFLATVYLHFQTNDSLHFRYDAYLVTIGIIAVTLPLFRYLSVAAMPRGLSRRVLLALGLTGAILLAAVPLAHRGWLKMRVAPLETRRVFEQHYQMSKFLKRYYEGSVVAANDIGAINYYADIETVDLWGLGSNDVARKRQEIRKNVARIEQATDLKKDLYVLSEEDINELTRSRGADIALVYDEIYEIGGVSRIPDSWILVGRWIIYRYERDYYDKVSFYAVDPAAEERLKRDLREFSPELPVYVQEDGAYTRGGNP